MLRLKELRLNKGLSQQKVADFLGVSQQAYANYESGKRKPEYDLIVKLSNFFGTTTDYLLGNTDIKKAPSTKDEGQISDEDLKIALFHGASDVTDEMWEEAKEYARFIYEREQKKREKK